MASSTVASVTSMITSITPSATSALPPSSTSSEPSPASSTSSSSSGDSGSGRPLLFFVALGFGVVFTNLWIIVGIKYCFRYNRRMRAGLINDDNGEPIDLNTLPGHRPRRRREKKLMTMDEVNERFPLSRYKMWKSAREQQGLAPEGGVTAPTTRPSSIHAPHVAEATEPDSKKSATIEAKPTTEPMTPLEHPADTTKDFGSTSQQTSAPAKEVVETEKDHAVEHNEQATRTQTTQSEELEEDERDPIDEPIHPGLAGYYPEEAPAGDSCAICIDILEDDDEVRGLTCGHAFHAGCLDPWLTGRRACCPLCKADYYVPKPRPEGDAGAQAGPLGSSAPAAGRRAIVNPERGGSVTMPHFPGRTRRMIFGGPPNPTRVNSSASERQPAYNPRAMRQAGDSVGARAMSWFRRIPDNLPSVGMRQRQGERPSTQPTPADLEAGRTTAGMRL